MLNSTIANFFAIVLQYNSNKYSKNKIVFYSLFSPEISLLSLIIQLSSLSSFSLSPSALSSLQTQTPFSSQHTSHITSLFLHLLSPLFRPKLHFPPNIHHTSQWLSFSGGLQSGGSVAVDGLRCCGGCFFFFFLL